MVHPRQTPEDAPRISEFNINRQIIPNELGLVGVLEDCDTDLDYFDTQQFVFLGRSCGVLSLIILKGYLLNRTPLTTSRGFNL